MGDHLFFYRIDLAAHLGENGRQSAGGCAVGLDELRWRLEVLDLKAWWICAAVAAASITSASRPARSSTACRAAG